MKAWSTTLVVVLMIMAVMVGGCESDEEPPTRFSALSEVKCDGEEYHLAVKPGKAVVLIHTSNVREHNIEELKLSGLIDEIHEIGRSDDDRDSMLVIHVEEWYGTTRLMELPYSENCRAVYVAGLPSGNRDALLQNIQGWGDYTYLLLSSNTRDKDVRLSFTGRFES